MKQSTNLPLQKNRASPETVGRFFCGIFFYPIGKPYFYPIKHNTMKQLSKLFLVTLIKAFLAYQILVAVVSMFYITKLFIMVFSFFDHH